MTTVVHPSLRGHAGPQARTRRRGIVIPGEATGAFWLIAAVVTVLNMIGIVMVMSASSVVSVRESGEPFSYFQRQLMWTGVGMVALVATLSVSLDLWRRHVKVWLGVSIAMLVAVLIPGVGITVNGASRWLGAGPFQLQPSELTKFALLLFVADLLARRGDHIDDWRWGLLPVLVYLGVVSGLIMLQPNLGTTVIIVAMVLAMLFAAGVPLVPLTLTTAVFSAGAAGFVAFTPWRRARTMRFLDPMSDPLGTGLQNVQSAVAMANGGWFGRGLGRSTVKWGYLPYAWTDFIFAVIGEELGLMGALLVVLLFFALAALGLWAAARAEDRFATLVAVGITAWLVVQAILNIGAVISLLPITGVPLPFVSFGGSSLVVNLAAVGMLLNIARHPRPTPASER